MVVVVLTFLFIDMFDTIGTLIGVSNRAGMVDDNGNVKNLNQAFMADAIGTTVGAMLGTSTVTTVAVRTKRRTVRFRSRSRWMMRL